MGGGRPLGQGNRVAELPAAAAGGGTGGGATLFGKLPAEGKLATEDEADESEEEGDGSYKTGESSEEESGEESGEGPEE